MLDLVKTKRRQKGKGNGRKGKISMYHNSYHTYIDKIINNVISFINHLCSHKQQIVHLCKSCAKCCESRRIARTSPDQVIRNTQKTIPKVIVSE